MKALRFNRNAPYADVVNADDDPSLRGARFQQGGHLFRGDGSWIIPSEVDAALVEDPDPVDLVPHFDTTEAIDEAHMRALANIYGVTYESGMTEQQIWDLMKLPGE